MEIQDAKQARPHCELIAELLDSRQPKTEREHAAVREIERLRHDIERHIAMASELATENERLRADNERLLLDVGALVSSRDEARSARYALRTDKESLMVGRDFLLAEIESMNATLERLREYAGHRLGCASRTFILTGRMEPAQWKACDCGYDDLVKEIGE
jgi:chromosome segregation ATPase